MASNNHFGWSLSDSVDDPRRTGLANFRHKLLVHRQNANNPLTDADEELVASASLVMASISDETSASNAAKPYYRREPSVSQCSDSCFGSDYPSLTSTGSSEPESMARTWMASSGASRSTGWAVEADASLSGPSSTSTDCWRGSIHHAMAVMEHREEEISSLFDQLHEIEDDLTSMNNQVGQVSHSLQQCQRRQDRPAARKRRSTTASASSLYQSHSVNSLHRQGSFSSFVTGRRHRNCASSCRDLNSLTEDEMADIVHRLLTRICEFSLARQEGRNDIPLIV